MSRPAVAAVALVALLSLGSMLAHRLLIAGGGGAIAAPVSALTELTASPNGGWSEPQYPKAVRHGDHVYIGIVAGGASGDVIVLSVDEATLTPTSHVLNASLHGEGSTADMHSNPAIAVRPSDHRLVAVYTDHTDSTVRLRVSVNSLDSDPDISGGFDTERSLDAELATSNYDYPIVLFQADAAYLFFRSTQSGTSRWLYSTNAAFLGSGHSGATGWSANRWLYRNTGFEPYMQIMGDGASRIDFIAQNKNEAEVTNNEIRHGYLESGTFYTSDGTPIDTAPLSTPLTPSDLTLAASGAGFHLFGLERDASSGEIAFTASARVVGAHQVWRIAWDGAAWDDEVVTTSDAPYSWGNVLDPDDHDHALVSRWSSGVADLWDARKIGSGWVLARISPGGADDWLWPIFVRDGTSALRAMVLYGTYTTYTDSGFLLGVYALTD